MISKPKVLILTDWFVPGFKAGGPIQSVNNLVKSLESELDIYVLTGDRDLNDTAKYAGVLFDQWQKVGGHHRFYLSNESMFRVLSEFRKSENLTFYFNSFFSIRFTIIPLLWLWLYGKLPNVVLAPRGMLGSGALSLKRSKKTVFIFLFKLLGLHRRIRFHSTDRSETKDMITVFGDQSKIIEVTNIPVSLAFDSKRKTEKVSFLFASRISPKKNLEFLIDSFLSAQVLGSLNIYGTKDDEQYVENCFKKSKQSAEIKIFEPVKPDLLLSIYRTSDFFVLPTLNENFGHSIIEALACGTPVIISDQTPWNDLEEFGAGWVIPLEDRARWERVLIEASRMHSSDYEQMSQRAIEYVRTKFDLNEIRTQYTKLFGAKN